MKWTFRVAVLGVVSVILAMSAGGASGAPRVVSTSIKADRVIVDVLSGVYQIIDREEGHRIKMEDCAYPAAPGKPQLPARRFLIALPPGARVTSVEARGTGATSLPGHYRIEPAPSPIPLADPVRRALLSTTRRSTVTSTSPGIISMSSRTCSSTISTAIRRWPARNP